MRRPERIHLPEQTVLSEPKLKVCDASGNHYSVLSKGVPLTMMSERRESLALQDIMPAEVTSNLLPIGTQGVGSEYSPSNSPQIRAQRLSLARSPDAWRNH